MRASDADRERIAQVLHTALSDGRITMDELEERLTTVYAATTLGDLKPVTADLPSSGVTVEPAATHALGLPDNRIGGHPGSRASLAIMSSAVRKGSWILPPQHTTVAFWGSAQIDLRNARFSEKQSTITAVAIMAGIEIVVPDDINVDVTGVGLMGNFGLEDRSGAGPALPTAPTVTINGLAFMGSVVVFRKRARRRHAEQDDRPEVEAG